MHRLILNLSKKPPKCSLTSLFFSKSIFSYATLAAVDNLEVPPNDVASAIFTHLINFNFEDKRGFAKRLRHDPEFNTLVSGLSAPEADGILEKLRFKYPETALDFFFLLKNEYDFRHSRDSYLSIAHILAKKERFRALRFHLLQMVQIEEFL